jgi:hypothetical protein
MPAIQARYGCGQANGLKVEREQELRSRYEIVVSLRFDLVVHKAVEFPQTMDRPKVAKGQPLTCEKFYSSVSIFSRNWERPEANDTIENAGPATTSLILRAFVVISPATVSSFESTLASV